MAKQTKLLQIFRAGRHTAMSGATLAFSDVDLEATAAAYDPAKSEAPIVVGHPTTDGPAYGWVRSLSFADGRLEAEPHQVDPAFAELVEAGRFKKISASFFTPGAANNPVPGVYYLRHVGFLGAQPPAVKGLRSPSFDGADTDEGILSFTVAFADPSPPQEILMTPEALAALEAAYEAERRDDGKLPATYEVVYGHAWAIEGRRRQPQDVHTFPLEKLRRR
jgi:hypothetical protein